MDELKFHLKKNKGCGMPNSFLKECDLPNFKWMYTSLIFHFLSTGTYISCTFLYMLLSFGH